MGSKKHILKEAFVGALLVASIIVILKHFGLLDRIKIITLNAVSSTVATSFSGDAIDKNEDLSSKKIENNTSLLVIDQKNYEINFNQRSPLDRKLLAQYIKKISESNPKILAIDLDLSPNPNILVSDEKSLDSLCDKDLVENKNEDDDLKESLSEISKKTKVVLLFPEPVQCMSVRNRKIKWVQNTLENGNGNIYFALGKIFEQDGMSLKYIDAESNFSKTIYSLYKEGEENKTHKKNFFLKIINQLYGIIKNEENLSSDRYGFLINEIGIDERSLSKLLNKPLNESIDIDEVYGEYLREYNFKYNKSINEIARRISKISDITNIDKEIIILGSDYGETDHFKTPIGFQPGVFLHYAALFSINPKIKISEIHIIDFIIEIFIGFVLGFLLKIFTRNTIVLDYFVFRSALILFIFAFMVFLIYSSSIVLVCFNLWISPGPIFFGIIIHELVNYIKKEGVVIKNYSYDRNYFEKIDCFLRKIFVFFIPFIAIIILVLDLVIEIAH